MQDRRIRIKVECEFETKKRTMGVSQSPLDSSVTPQKTAAMDQLVRSSNDSQPAVPEQSESYHGLWYRVKSALGWILQAIKGFGL